MLLEYFLFGMMTFHLSGIYMIFFTESSAVFWFDKMPNDMHLFFFAYFLSEVNVLCCFFRQGLKVK